MSDVALSILLETSRYVNHLFPDLWVFLPSAKEDIEALFVALREFPEDGMRFEFGSRARDEFPFGLRQFVEHGPVPRLFLDLALGLDVDVELRFPFGIAPIGDRRAFRLDPLIPMLAHNFVHGPDFEIPAPGLSRD